jgi:hypothetical protein
VLWCGAMEKFIPTETLYFSYLGENLKAGLQMMAEAFQVAAAADCGKAKLPLLCLRSSFAEVIDAFFTDDGTLPRHEVRRNIDQGLKETVRLLRTAVELGTDDPKAAPVLDAMKSSLEQAAALMAAPPRVPASARVRAVGEN